MSTATAPPPATPTDLAALRDFALNQPGDAWTRVLGIAICAALLASVLYLVHRGKLREEYTPVWVVVSVGMMLVIASSDLLRLVTQSVGAWTPSSALFFFGLVFLLGLSLNYAVRLSGMSLQLRLLAQEVALLRAREARTESGGDLSSEHPQTADGEDAPAAPERGT